MFKKFYPTVYIPSVYTVDFSKIFNKGYKGLILDIDNTFVEHGAPANEEATMLFSKLHDIGFKTCIISNNHEERVKSFADKVNSLYIYEANKPSKENYIKAAMMMDVPLSQALFIGDQLFTDILGANNAKIKSILVKPINIDPYFYIKLKRLGEKIVLPFYFRYARKHQENLLSLFCLASLH